MLPDDYQHGRPKDRFLQGKLRLIPKDRRDWAWASSQRPYRPTGSISQLIVLAVRSPSVAHFSCALNKAPRYIFGPAASVHVQCGNITLRRRNKCPHRPFPTRALHIFPTRALHIFLHSTAVLLEQFLHFCCFTLLCLPVLCNLHCAICIRALERCICMHMQLQHLQA